MVRVGVRVAELFHWLTGFFPATKTTVHGNHICVAHVLQIQGREGGTISAATVQHNWCIDIRDVRFDVTFDHAFAKVHGGGNMAGGKFTFLPHIDQIKGLSPRPAVDDILNIAFPDLRSNRIYNVQKSLRMMLCHNVFP